MADFDNAKLYGYDPIDQTWVPIMADEAGHMVVHSGLENRIHDGLAFAFGRYVASVADAANIDILLVTNSAELFTKLQTKVGGDALLSVYEGVTVSNNGTSLGMLNLNRNSANTIDVASYHTPTITDLGTLIFQMYLPGGTSPHASGGADEFTQGIFKTGTNYLLRLTNISGSTRPMQLLGIAFEHPPILI